MQCSAHTTCTSNLKSTRVTRQYQRERRRWRETRSRRVQQKTVWHAGDARAVGFANARAPLGPTERGGDTGVRQSTQQAEGRARISASLRYQLCLPLPLPHSGATLLIVHKTDTYESARGASVTPRTLAIAIARVHSARLTPDAPPMTRTTTRARTLSRDDGGRAAICCPARRHLVHCTTRSALLCPHVNTSAEAVASNVLVQ